MTDLDPTTTLLSVDGIGAFDLISREVVAGTYGRGWERCCPPFRAYIGGPIMWASRTRSGKARVVNRAMPALYACGQHRALVHVSEDLLDTGLWIGRCGSTRGSDSIKARRNCGIEAEWPQRDGKG